ncbi:response regulator [Gramella sp. AN32]|uniref:Response regulator n=1 Tax=Christiangramia antarctica TaxID=2058158 RepID=A0ABW5X4D0_9FLAO|nr:response regulator [Gramella sp. AN32]MCM4157092.1 response regulator [Gramella sp. AN32]
MIRTLIIDDDHLTMMLQKRLVIKCELDIDPFTFSNPLNALEFLQSENSEDSFLILLDINMPILTGWEFLEKLKLIPHNDKYHVVMATASMDRKDKRKAANDNLVIDFVEKPLSARHCEKLKGIAKLSHHYIAC